LLIAKNPGTIIPFFENKRLSVFVGQQFVPGNQPQPGPGETAYNYAEVLADGVGYS